MPSANQFNGLMMPVFTAFGWAGEETAIKYALEQMELFINALHARLPRATQSKFPHVGVNAVNQAVYLAASPEVEGDIHIAFYARPMSLELQLAITDEKVLAKGLKEAQKQPALAHRLITELGADWTLRVQQMQVDEETGEVSHYQDLFKDSVANLDEEAAVALFDKAAYLNGEDKWVTPIYLSRRFPSEQASNMGRAIVEVMSEHVASLMPLLSFLTGRKTRKEGAARTRASAKAKAKPAAAEVVVEESQIDPEEGFTYVSVLKPLHLRRGFVNLTPRHWPFFAVNSRTETRPVTVYYDGVYDKDSAVWRLLPNDQARLVLSPSVHHWLEDHFEPNDRIQVTAKKLDDQEIQVSLKAVG
ncbi:MAG TPA: hypothetical protein VF177_15910 [Anaerolineae bacterium]